MISFSTFVVVWAFLSVFCFHFSVFRSFSWVPFFLQIVLPFLWTHTFCNAPVSCIHGLNPCVWLRCFTLQLPTHCGGNVGIFFTEPIPLGQCNLKVNFPTHLFGMAGNKCNSLVYNYTLFTIILHYLLTHLIKITLYFLLTLHMCVMFFRHREFS